MLLTHREFRRLVRQAYDELPPELESRLENVAILVEDWPGEDDLDIVGSDGEGQLFGLYRGVPLPDRGGGLPPMPDTVTLFQRPIESVCASYEEVVREIRITLVHEVGHYLGMTEEDLDRLGYG